MRIIQTALCMGLIATAGAALAQEVPVLRKGTPYSTARGLLLEKGFRPVASAEQDEGRCSAGRQDVCAAYPETISCSGTGAGACHFIFASPAGGAVTVIAEGRDAGRLKITDTRRSSRDDVEWQRKGQ
jgi:hypothetical protein